MSNNDIKFLSDAEQFVIDREAWHEQKRACSHIISNINFESNGLINAIRNVLGKIISGRNAIVDYYYDSEIDENSILISGLGTSVRGSMQYVLNELNYNDKYARFKIYVRTSEQTDPIVKQYIKQNKWKRTHTVLKNYTKYLETCKFLMTESYFPSTWIKKPGQIVINLWHGTPLKKLGLLKNGKKSHTNSKQQKNFLSTDYFLYPNQYTKDVMLASYKISSLYAGSKALMLGYPRTAGMLGIKEEQTLRLRRELAPNGERIYAYMPTFRGYLSDEKTVEREKLFLQDLDAKLHDDQLIYVNLHHHVGATLDFSGFRHIKKFPSLVDSYELLTATDALISDYSSVFFDYLILGKQIILHIDDYDTYLKHQGLNMDIRDLPFDLAKTPDEVIAFLNRGKAYDDSAIRSSLCANDSIDNPAKLCQLFNFDEAGLNIVPFQDNGRKKVLLYSEQCKSKQLTDILSRFFRLDLHDLDCWIGCDHNKVNENGKNAYPLLNEAPMISSKGDSVLSPLGNAVKRMYFYGRFSFDEAMKYLVHEYALMPVSMYGYAKFDELILYEVEDPELIIAFALSSAKRKALFLTEAIFQKISEGNLFMRDAVRFASSYCHVIAVHDEEHIAMAELLLPERWKGKISAVVCEEGLLRLAERMKEDVQ